jgi:hypothetical protein
MNNKRIIILVLLLIIISLGYMVLYKLNFIEPFDITTTSTTNPDITTTSTTNPDTTTTSTNNPDTTTTSTTNNPDTTTTSTNNPDTTTTSTNNPDPTTTSTNNPEETTSACSDSSDWVSVGKENQNCDWVRSRPSAWRCKQKNSDGEKASAHCRKACKTATYCTTSSTIATPTTGPPSTIQNVKLKMSDKNFQLTDTVADLKQAFNIYINKNYPY